MWLERKWRHHGDVLSVVGFQNDSLVISNYFGKKFMVPLNAYIESPSFLLKQHYPFEVLDDVVLDIGAYLGDTPLMWLYKGARSVIAVEPVPLHFQYLTKNVSGLPVTCLNMSLAIQLPYVRKEGSIGYGHRLWDEANGHILNVPVVQLTELVERYRPTVVKLDCEGCEHYVRDQLWQLPQFDVKKIAVEFHGIDAYHLNEELDFFMEKLGGDYRMWKIGGKYMVYWYRQ
jgi:FkbM family methyltransferase